MNRKEKRFLYLCMSSACTKIQKIHSHLLTPITGKNNSNIQPLIAQNSIHPFYKTNKKAKGDTLRHIPFCQHPCPASAIVFFETCFINSYPRTIFSIVYLFSIGTYSRVGFTPIYAGRMIFPAFCSSSRRWALQPAMRAIAKIGVNSSHGRSSIRYISPE